MNTSTATDFAAEIAATPRTASKEPTGYHSAMRAIEKRAQKKFPTAMAYLHTVTRGEYAETTVFTVQVWETRKVRFGVAPTRKIWESKPVLGINEAGLAAYAQVFGR